MVRIKIGYTKGLDQRLKQLSLPWSALLAVMPGGYAEEQELLKRFAEHRVYRLEYFRPAAEVIAYINEIRAGMNLSTLPMPEAA